MVQIKNDTRSDELEIAYDVGLGAGLTPALELCNPYPYATSEHGAWEQGRATGEALRTEHLLTEDSA